MEDVVCKCVHVCGCMRVSAHVCVCVCMCVYVSVCVNTCVFMLALKQLNVFFIEFVSTVHRAELLQWYYMYYSL
jgi:hypothetical protein